MITIEQKNWIDNATYTELLNKHRFAPFGDPFFINDTGEYFKKIMAEKRRQITDEEHTKTSKVIGWD